jgi:hypothetical protein
MMRGFHLLSCVLLALPAMAQTPLSGPEFDSYSRGKTLTFNDNGQAYGVERYFSGNRVQWSFLDGVCVEGFWYPQDSFICFVYDANPDPQCWTFYKEGGSLRAVFEGDPDGIQLFETAETKEEMLCLGPEVGV